MGDVPEVQDHVRVKAPSQPASPVANQRLPTPPPVESPRHNSLANVMGTADQPNCLYEKVKVIGSGSFGEAWLVRRRADQKLFVAKLLELHKMSVKDQKYVESEIHCLAACNHFAVVKFEQSFVADPEILIVMEFADAGDLNTQIKARNRNGMKYFEEHEVGYTFVQLCMALEHVHRHKMLHRDIKGANVLLMSSGIVKLGDFGFSQQYEDTVSGAVAETFCGTPYYLAPELWKRQKYSKKADVWALGILLYEMMALKRPFIAASQKALMALVLQGDIEPLPKKFTHDLRELCMNMLNPDPDKRLSMAQILQHPYMQKLLRDFEKSAKASPHVDEATKVLVAKAAAEARQSAPDDHNNGGAVTRRVGVVNAEVNHEGVIRKESNRVWKERYLVLKDGELIIAVNKGDTNTRAVSVQTLASVVPVPVKIAKAEGVFALNTQDNKTMWMQAPTKAECQTWIHRLQQAMGVA